MNALVGSRSSNSILDPKKFPPVLKFVETEEDLKQNVTMVIRRVEMGAMKTAKFKLDGLAKEEHQSKKIHAVISSQLQQSYQLRLLSIKEIMLFKV